MMKKLIAAMTAVSTVTSVLMVLRDRGLGKEDDRALISDAASAVAGLPVNGEAVTIMHDGKGYTMYKLYNPYLMCFLGCTGGIACTSGSVIVVSDVFRKLPDDVQEGIIAHEFGHVINGHQGSRKLQFNRMAGGSKSLSLEMEADRTAALIAGRKTMLRTLRHMMTLPFMNKRELRKRIHALEKEA